MLRLLTEYGHLQRRAAAAQEFAHFMGQAVKLPDLPVGVAMAGGLALFEVYGWFVVGEIIGKRQLIGKPSLATAILSCYCNPLVLLQLALNLLMHYLI